MYMVCIVEIWFWHHCLNHLYLPIIDRFYFSLKVLFHLNRNLQSPQFEKFFYVKPEDIDEAFVDVNVENADKEHGI